MSKKYPILHDGCHAPRPYHLRAPDHWYNGLEVMTWGLMSAIGSPISCVWEYEHHFLIEYKNAAGGGCRKVSREDYLAAIAEEEQRPKCSQKPAESSGSTPA